MAVIVVFVTVVLVLIEVLEYFVSSEICLQRVHELIFGTTKREHFQLFGASMNFSFNPMIDILSTICDENLWSFAINWLLQDYNIMRGCKLNST